MQGINVDDSRDCVLLQALSPSDDGIGTDEAARGFARCDAVREATSKWPVAGFSIRRS